MTEAQTDAQTTVHSIVLTGGASSTGLKLTRTLTEAGHKVSATASNSETAAQVRANGGLPVYADLTRAGEVKSLLAMTKGDMVIHLAPQAANQLPFLSSGIEPQTIIDTTVAVVEAAQQAGVTYLVHVSYACIYGNTGSGSVDEQTMPESESDVALVQAAQKAEQIVRESGIAYCILRAGYIYSADSQVMQAVADTLRVGRPLPMGAADHMASWIHADDLAMALALVVQQRPQNEIFNIVDDTPVSPRQFLHDFGAALGVQVSSGLPGMLALARLRSGGDASDLLNLSFNASNAKAKQQLGWRPRFGAHSAGIDDVLLTWRAETPVH